MEGDKDACRSCCKKNPEEALKITAEQKIATVTLIPLQKIHKKRDTARKVFKFEVFLVRIFPRSG